MTDDTCGEPTNDDEPCQLAPSQPDGRCHHHTESDQVGRAGRPSKFEDTRDELLEVAREPVKTRDVARSVGIGKSTLYDWLDEKPEFSDAFRRARADAARKLVRDGLQDPDVDTSMIRFLLERTFEYTKTQELEHSGDGLTINLPDSVGDY